MSADLQKLLEAQQSKPQHRNSFYTKEHSPETRAKISKTLTGRPTTRVDFTQTDEAKAKISQAKKGKAPPNKGKKLSAEWCANLSASHMGYVVKEETKAKIRAAFIGKPRSPETIAKIKETWRLKAEAKAKAKKSK